MSNCDLKMILMAQSSQDGTQDLGTGTRTVP
jgi:hypothetical protein